MLSYTLDVLIVALTITSSMLLMWALDRLWPWEKRHAHNDLIGWQLSILGTTYAVILGFMLYAVWTDFGAASLNVELEASSLRNLYRIAEALPDQQRSELQNEARTYADAVVSHEWPEMGSGQLPNESHAINRNMWKTVMSAIAASSSQTVAEDHALSELTSLTEHRRIRLSQSQASIPGILWFVLIVGGILTIGSSCLFGAASSTLHGLQVFAFSLLVSLVLLAIADINSPFRGSVHISVFAFQRAQQNMND
jgi:hypothetical protein